MDIKITFEENAEFTVRMDSYIGGGSGVPYTGDYEVTPKVTPQTLYTKSKQMSDDVTVHPIPYHEVSNTDGTTIIIGG